MLSFVPLPQARIVRTAGQLVAPPPTPPAPPGQLRVQLREAFAIALGLWPLTSVLLLGLGLLALAGLYSSP